MSDLIGDTPASTLDLVEDHRNLREALLEIRQIATMRGRPFDQFNLAKATSEIMEACTEALGDGREEHPSPVSKELPRNLQASYTVSVYDDGVEVESLCSIDNIHSRSIQRAVEALQGEAA